MSDELVARLRSLDNFSLLRFFKSFGKGIITELDLDRETLVEYVDSSAIADPALVEVINLPADRARASLSQDDAVAVARSTLEAMARHPNLRNSLKDALEGFKDDEMPASIILALGFAATMIIVAATTKLRISFSGGKIEGEVVKEVAPPEILKEVMEPLATASKKLISS